MRLPCPACGAPLSTGLQDWHRECAACRYEGSVLQPRIQSQADGGDLDEAAREQSLEPLRKENFRTLRARIQPLVAGRPGKPSLLDVGCAHGWFLEECAGHFTVAGIEPDIAVAAAARARGLPVRTGFFPDAVEPGERFDLISFNDVLEHIPDLASTLAACHRHLREDGLLVVNAPCRRGVFYRLARLLARMGIIGPFNRLWQVGFPSPHLHYFDTPTLSAIAGREGFTLASRSTLPTISVKGLYSRIRYAREGSALSAALLTAAITCGRPLLGILPADIHVWIFRRGRPPGISPR